MSAIQWTDETWNPTTGCSPVSEGCRNCYAAREAIRLGGNPNPKVSDAYQGTAEMRGSGISRRAVFTGTVHMHENRLDQPLRWRKPRRVFVDSMSDLFHEAVHRDFLLRVWGVMAQTPRHTYQILTKRPDRMARLLGEWMQPALTVAMVNHVWPLPNVWLGTSVEDQAAADERVPHLLQTPAAVRFLSCEPLLGPVRLDAPTRHETEVAMRAGFGASHAARPIDGIHWVIVGGESGPGARPCNVQWIRDIVRQCRLDGVPAFVKQLGALPYFTHGRYSDLRDRKGGDPSEWPADLRVREFPEVGRG